MINPLLISRRAMLGSALSLAATLPVQAESVDERWQHARAQWLLSARTAYFDMATLAPALRGVLAAQYRAQEALHSDPAAFYGRLTGAAVQSQCIRLASWLDCAPDEVCGMGTVSSALTLVAEQLPLQSGDEILVSSQLPDTLLSYWQQRAERSQCVLKVLQLPMPLNRELVMQALTEARTERSRVLCVSHVQRADGAILPIKELCNWAREQGLITLIDGTFSLGALNFSVRDLNCDAYASSLCHWLNGATPSAVLYVRRDLHAAWSNQAIDLPTGLSLLGWPSLQQRWPQQFIEQAVAFQALNAALDWQVALGRSAIEQRLLQLYSYARVKLQNLNGVQLLTPNEPGRYLHLLALQVRRPQAVAEWLLRNDQVIVSTTTVARDNLQTLRISLHHANTLDEIDRLSLGLQRAIRA